MLARLSLPGWRSQKERAVESLPQAQGRLNIPTQIGGHNVIVDYLTVGPRPSAPCGRRQVDNSIHKTKCRRAFVEYERGVRMSLTGIAAPSFGRVSGLSVMAVPRTIGVHRIADAPTLDQMLL